MIKPNDSEVRDAASPVERLARLVGTNANASVIYGEPVERDGVTVIPVGKVRYGFGGGFAHKVRGDESGGGGGMYVTPIGYIELKGGSSEFRPIRDPSVVARVLMASGFLGLMLIKSVLRGRRRR